LRHCARKLSRSSGLERNEVSDDKRSKANSALTNPRIPAKSSQSSGGQDSAASSFEATSAFVNQEKVSIRLLSQYNRFTFAWIECLKGIVFWRNDGPYVDHGGRREIQVLTELGAREWLSSSITAVGTRT